MVQKYGTKANQYRNWKVPARDTPQGICNEVLVTYHYVEFRQPIIVYNELLNLHNQGYRTWCKTVMRVMEDLDYKPMWDSHCLGVVSTEIDIYNVKLSLQNKYSAGWSAAINDVSKHPVLRTYRLYKTKHCAGPYLLCNLNPKYKKCIAKFRVSSHSLAIETGRHTKPAIPIEQRICRYCNNIVVDDELHFLLICPFNSTEREELIYKAHFDIHNFSALSASDKMAEIMRCQNKIFLSSFGKFLKDSFLKRKLHPVE